ncbi:MAG: hypothetical protein DRO67_01740 [Candidatus Asgardarchaeum californiense]|nr:MAG: hypothetical protein DRO67_01740 [Candidatus Asgardarchaeum californiense]
MILYRKQKIAFIHIPKTAGSSFREMWRQKYGPWEYVAKLTNHEPLSDVVEIIGRDFFDTLSVTSIIRNPLGAAVSHFNAVHNNHDPKLIEKYPLLKGVPEMDFDQYINWYVTSPHVHSYYDYLTLDGEIPSNVNIIRQRDAVKIPGMPRINITPKNKPGLELLDDNTTTKIKKYNKWAFDKWYG